MEIYLLRHGLSEGNLEGYFQGRLDPPLAELGRSQALAAGNWLLEQGTQVDVLYTSPLKRAYQTAEIVAGRLKPGKMQADENLMEYSGGELEGKRKEEINRLFPDYTIRSLSERGDFSAYGGESYDSMQQRLTAFTEMVAGNHADGQNILVVTHGGTLYQLLKFWCGNPVPRHYFTRLSNCVCIKLRLREILGQNVGELQWMVPLEIYCRELDTASNESKYPPAE